MYPEKITTLDDVEEFLQAWVATCRDSSEYAPTHTDRVQHAYMADAFASALQVVEQAVKREKEAEDNAPLTGIDMARIVTAMDDCTAETWELEALRDYVRELVAFLTATNNKHTALGFQLLYSAAQNMVSARLDSR